jgi:hypothetical protein
MATSGLGRAQHASYQPPTAIRPGTSAAGPCPLPAARRASAAHGRGATASCSPATGRQRAGDGRGSALPAARRPPAAGRLGWARQRPAGCWPATGRQPAGDGRSSALPAARRAPVASGLRMGAAAPCLLPAGCWRVESWARQRPASFPLATVRRRAGANCKRTAKSVRSPTGAGEGAAKVVSTPPPGLVREQQKSCQLPHRAARSWK